MPFADAAKDILQRFANVRLSTSTVLRCTEGASERLQQQLRAGRMVKPTQPEPDWTGPREPGQPAAYVGLDAFSVPMQSPKGKKAEHRMLYLACPGRSGRAHWADEAKGILYERGGEALLEFLHTLLLPKGTRSEVREERRKLIGYFEHNRHRTDYPTYRHNAWDIGSGPTEAGGKIIGERLKGSGMRWVEHGAATIGVLRALYVSSPKLWDGFWEQPRAAA